MTITYYFDDEPFEYELEETLVDFITDVIPFGEQVSIYLDEIYDKDADERDLIYQDFGLKSRTEVNDYIWGEGGDWLPEAISDNAEDYIMENYEDEIKEYFQEDAINEYQGGLDTQAMYDEAEHYYWSSR